MYLFTWEDCGRRRIRVRLGVQGERVFDYLGREWGKGDRWRYIGGQVGWDNDLQFGISYKFKRPYYNVKMSEQLDLDKPEKHFEGRYKYLADFSKHQFSPNLRKHYNDSFSKRSNSHDRRSSYNNSHQKMSSFKKSQDIARYSPSCNTFNPRRETTQQEFSPYDERVDKEEERLNKELLEENGHLRSQLMQAGQTIDALKNDLAKRETQILQIKEMSQADLRYFQKLVTEMTNEIQIVLTKNKILENQLVVVKSKLHEELRRQDQILRYEEEKRRIEDYRKREDSRRQDNLRRNQDGRRYQQQRRNTPQPVTKRSVGKLLVRPVGNIQNESLGTSKIKIQEQSQVINQSNIETMKPIENKPTQSQARKGQQLIGSIKSMQLKITGDQSSSLKDLWKWLKGIGHTHSCLKRWKAKANEASSYYPSDKLKELIREACGYIQ